MTKFIAIACINQNGALGKDGKLLYHVGNDLKNFRSMTSFNGVVIMGRKTYESIGEPLKDRINIILTSNEEFGIDPKYENVYIVHSVKDAVELCDAFFYDKEVFVIGGESIYHQFMDANLITEMRLTIVNDNADGDVFFPTYDEDDWYVYYKSMAQVSSWEGMDKSFYYVVLMKKR